MKTIYAVDDCDTNLAKIEESLESWYCVMTMPSAAKMFSLLEKVRPDLILLDIEMPETDGFAALQRLKTMESYSNIPVIFLTGHADAAIESKCYAMGAVDVISKPFSVPAILNRINSFIDINGAIANGCIDHIM